MSIKKPDPNDMIIGQRIRAARGLAGISQTVLANKLGVTFQQVQKYEKGVNRVSMGRLAKISDVTQQPLSSFSEGMGNGSKGVDTAFIDVMLGTAHGIRAMRAYAKLDAATQRAVSDLLEALTQDGFQ